MDLTYKIKDEYARSVNSKGGGVIRGDKWNEEGRDIIVDDLSEFSNIDRKDIVIRLSSPDGGYHTECEKHFKNRTPTPEEVRYFYESTDVSFVSTVAWHEQPTQKYIRECIANAIESPCLNWGCGIGTESILAAQQGKEILCADYGLTLDFFKFRVKKRFPDLPITFMSPDDMGDLRPDSFQSIVCIDVLEHLIDPDTVLDTFRNLLKDDGIFIGSAPFGYHQHNDSEIFDGHYDRHLGKDLLTMVEAVGIERYWIDCIRPIISHWKG